MKSRNLLIPLAMITAGGATAVQKSLVLFGLGFAIWMCGVWIWFQHDRAQREQVRKLYQIWEKEFRNSAKSESDKGP